MKPPRATDRCRACGNGRLVDVLSLGAQALTGVFPRARDEAVPEGPLELIRCAGNEDEACGLVQLRHDFDPEALYGDGYGYRSGLNPSMARHLRKLAIWALARAEAGPGALIVDIGSNDGTLLAAMPAHAKLAGVDPLARRFAAGYPPGTILVPELFSAERVRRELGQRQAALVIAAAMFYDVADPLEFLRGARSLLADDGLLVLELAYWPTLLERTAFDTICHEHVAYYGLSQLLWLAKRAGLAVLEAELNDANGGSFRVAFGVAGGPRSPRPEGISSLLEDERALQSDALHARFRERVLERRDALRAIVRSAAAEGRPIAGYGASTKGNVLLQFAGFTTKEIPVIGEVNGDKFGCFTPGTRIPIAPEDEVRRAYRDLLVLPWHFREFIVRKEEPFLRAGGRLLFPLPKPQWWTSADLQGTVASD